MHKALLDLIIYSNLWLLYLSTPFLGIRVMLSRQPSWGGTVAFPSVYPARPHVYPLMPRKCILEYIRFFLLNK